MGKKYTKKDLDLVATELNDLLNLEPPIPIDDENDIRGLEADIKDIFDNMLEESDELSERTEEVMGFLGLNRNPVIEEKPVDEVELLKMKKDLLGKEITEEEVIEKPQKEKPVVKEIKLKPKKSKEKYTRANAFCDALPGDPKTLTEIAKKAKELYDEKNPGKKQPKFVHIEWDIKMHYLPALILLGFVTVDKDKYFLKG